MKGQLLLGVVVAAATVLVTWLLGLDVPHAIVLGLGLALLVQLRHLPELARDDAWPERDLGRSDTGARREVARLSWGLSGFESRVDRRSVAQLRAVAEHRLALRGLSLSDPADEPAVRRLLDDRTWSVVTSDPADLPQFPRFSAAVRAVQHLDQESPR